MRRGFKVEDVAIQELQRPFGQDHLIAVDRRQPMDHNPARPSAIIGVAVQREYLAAIGPRRLDGLFEFGKNPLREGLTSFPGGHRDLDAEHRSVVDFTMKGEEDGIANLVSLAQP